MLELARRVSSDDFWIVIRVIQLFYQVLAHLFNAFCVANRLAVAIQHDKGVERPVVVGSSNAGIVDRESELLHGGSSGGEQVIHRAGVDEHFGAAFGHVGGGGTDQHQRQGGGLMGQNALGLPNDLAGGVLQEVVFPQRLPELVYLATIDADCLQQRARLSTGFAHPVVSIRWIFQPTAQSTFSFRVELAQKRCPPAVPQRGVGGVDIGNGEHIEVVQAGLVAHDEGEIADHIRVADISLLGGHRHQQVMLHQPTHQVGVVLGNMVAMAELFDVPRADF